MYVLLGGSAIASSIYPYNRMQFIHVYIPAHTSQLCFKHPWVLIIIRNTTVCSIRVDHFHIIVQNLPEDEVLRHGKEAVEAHFKSKFKEVGAAHCISLM